MPSQPANKRTVWQKAQQSAAVSAVVVGFPGMLGPNPLVGSKMPQCPTSLPAAENVLVETANSATVESIIVGK